MLAQLRPGFQKCAAPSSSRCTIYGWVESHIREAEAAFTGSSCGSWGYLNTRPCLYIFPITK